MRPYRSLAERANVEELIARLKRVSLDAPRQWGTLSVGEMLCHLGDSFEAVLGERQASPVDTLMSRTLVKWIAINTSIPWPHGVPTRPEVNPKALGTKPVDFEGDRQRVLTLLARFVEPGTICGPHPAFGTMSRAEWLRWGYGHVDHHLRQFAS